MVGNNTEQNIRSLPSVSCVSLLLRVHFPVESKVTPYWLRSEIGILPIVTSSRPALVSTSPHIQYVPGMKQPECEAYNSLPSIGEEHND
jgi:hypothetical protein